MQSCCVVFGVLVFQSVFVFDGEQRNGSCCDDCRLFDSLNHVRLDQVL